jgi:Nucleotidyl transferase AbiEii toxin, Type IV TA system
VITQADVAHWRTRVPWISPENVEQDLVLSRLIIEFANHPLLGDDLVFRGGTCFHKLWLDRPWRYSEDLDYVRRNEGGVGDVLDAIRDVARIVGFDDVRTEIGRHPKARLRSTFLSGQRLQIKVEMNTFERSPAQPAVHGRQSVVRRVSRGADLHDRGTDRHQDPGTVPANQRTRPVRPVARRRTGRHQTVGDRRMLRPLPT